MNPSESRFSSAGPATKPTTYCLSPGSTVTKGGGVTRLRPRPLSRETDFFFLTLHFLYFSVFDFQVVC